jgi:hypothetical protein
MSTNVSFAAWLQANQEVFADSDMSLQEKKQIWETEMKRIAARTPAPAKALSQQRPPASGGGFSLLDAQKPAKKLTQQRAQAFRTMDPKAGAAAHVQRNPFIFAPKIAQAASSTLPSVFQVEQQEEEDEEDEEYEANEEDEEDEEDEEEHDDDCKIVEGKKQKPVTMKKARTAFQLFMLDARKYAKKELKLKKGTPNIRARCNAKMLEWFTELPHDKRAEYDRREAAERKMFAAREKDHNPFKPLPTTGSAAPASLFAARTPAARALTPAPAASGRGKGKEAAGPPHRERAAGGSQKQSLFGIALKEFGSEVASAVGFGKSGKSNESQTETGHSVDAEELPPWTFAYFMTLLAFKEKALALSMRMDLRTMKPYEVAENLVQTLLSRLRQMRGDVPEPITYMQDDEEMSLTLDVATRNYLLHEDQYERLLACARENFIEYKATERLDAEAFRIFHDAAMRPGWRAGSSA